MVATSRSLRIAVLVAAALLTMASGVHGQVARPAGAGETILAVPLEYPDIDAPALVVREGARSLIVMRADAVETETLMMALSVLRDMKAARPNPKLGEMMAVTGFSVTQNPAPGRVSQLERALARLADAQVDDLGSVGRARWVRFAGS